MPASTWLADGRGRVELQVHPSTTLDLRLTSAADGAKIDGLIALGMLKAEEVNATLEEEELRAGHARVTVKPSDGLKGYFGIE